MVFCIVDNILTLELGSGVGTGKFNEEGYNIEAIEARDSTQANRLRSDLKYCFTNKRFGKTKESLRFLCPSPVLVSGVEADDCLEELGEVVILLRKMSHRSLKILPRHPSRFLC
ncbi:hypothetical protein AVEN_148421-1 [Araneus ventricosus]|uniref:Uncharacterized protein n=1 Tax=Araneus ventricosus TaxID=182803 RepID=A0A4Y2NXB2_ARAVE|nr:hypothetical protein AVEN_148421-1 [Araneus ventricosus]